MSNGATIRSPATTGPTLIAMTAPLVLSFWMRSAFSFVDTAYAATLGDAAIAAIGLAIPLEFLMIACWVGLSNGLTARLSQAMGAGQSTRIQQLTASAWRMILFVLLPLFLGTAAGIWFLAPHLGLSQQVATNFAIYGSVTLARRRWNSFRIWQTRYRGCEWPSLSRSERALPEQWGQRVSCRHCVRDRCG